MAGPPSNEEKQESMIQLKVGVVALVGASAGLITISGSGSSVQIAVAVGVGLLIGAVLLTYLAHIA
jgi:hypothetical protein